MRVFVSGLRERWTLVMVGSSIDAYGGLRWGFFNPMVCLWQIIRCCYFEYDTDASCPLELHVYSCFQVVVNGYLKLMKPFRVCCLICCSDFFESSKTYFLVLGSYLLDVRVLSPYVKFYTRYPTYLLLLLELSKICCSMVRDCGYLCY